MKKWILIVFAVCLLAVMMWKANVKTDELAQDQAATAEQKANLQETTVDWGVTMTVKNVTATGCTLEITQSGGKPTGEITCGCDYWLEQQKNGIWTKVELSEAACWTMEAYQLSGQNRTFPINWEYLYGTLPTGTYRVCKNIMDFRGTGNYDTAYHFSQPFVIE